MRGRGAKDSVITTVTTVSSAAAVIQRNIQIMRITLALTVLSFVTFIITLTSSYWVVITYPDGFYSVRHKQHVIRATYGIIWECVLGRPALSTVHSKYEEFISKNGVLERISKDY